MRYRTKDKFYNRIKLLVVVFFIAAAAMVGRLFYLQVVRHEYFTVRASGQYKIDREVLQKRGAIYMHDFRGNSLAPLTINRNLSLLYAVPSEVKRPADAAQILADILEPADQARRAEIEQSFYAKLSKEADPYEPLWHRLDDGLKAQIIAKHLAGIYFSDELVRYYPEFECAAQVAGFLGFSGAEQKGQYGIEGYFETQLAGAKGKMVGNKDVAGRIIPVAESELEAAENGSDIVLTLDKVIQEKACALVREAVESYAATAGSIIVMDPHSGDIKAMANFPSFDPNNYSAVKNIEIFKNPSITSAYEPGSIFKVITMAAGIDSAAVKPNDLFVDPGFAQIGVHTIRNANQRTFGEIDMAGILENSVNTGAMHVALLTGKETFRDYVRRFGFGAKTAIELAGEVTGDTSSLEKKGDIYLATAAFGQGITITPLQMASAVATIVNNGQRVYPRIVDQLRDSAGNLSTQEIKKGEAVISKDTAAIVKAMMVSVVKNGQAKKAQVPGYYIGGKTGTAEIANGGQYSQESIHSFVGFGPLENSKFVILVRLDKPRNGKWSSVTAAPTFAKLAEFLLQYYQVPPNAN